MYRNSLSDQEAAQIQMSRREKGKMVWEGANILDKRLPISGLASGLLSSSAKMSEPNGTPISQYTMILHSSQISSVTCT